MDIDELLTTLESPIVIRPTRRMTQGELESYLDKAADILRGNADHSAIKPEIQHPRGSPSIDTPKQLLNRQSSSIFGEPVAPPTSKSNPRESRSCPAIH